jgi:hypothetical protein
MSKAAVFQFSRYNVGLLVDMRKQRRHDCSASGMKLFFPLDAPKFQGRMCIPDLSSCLCIVFKS